MVASYVTQDEMNLGRIQFPAEKYEISFQVISWFQNNDTQKIGFTWFYMTQ